MLTQKQLQSIRLCLAGESVSAIVNAVNISERTYYRWQKLPEYRDKKREIYFELTGEFAGQLLTVGRQAVARLSRMVADGNEAAVFKAIDFLLRLNSQLELQEIKNGFDDIKLQLDAEQEAKDHVNFPKRQDQKAIEGTGSQDAASHTTL